MRLLGVQAGFVAPVEVGERQVMSGIHKRPLIRSPSGCFCRNPANSRVVPP
jgi:hypothetical protein